jgi:hypothetical protein
MLKSAHQMPEAGLGSMTRPARSRLGKECAIALANLVSEGGSTLRAVSLQPSIVFLDTTGDAPSGSGPLQLQGFVSGRGSKSRLFRAS